MSQVDVAERLGWSRSRVANYEADRRTPPLDTMIDFWREMAAIAT